jgi:hypothetical protein
MFSKVTSFISQTAITGLMVASIGAGLLGGTGAAHAGPLDDAAGAANVATMGDGGSSGPVTCTFDGRVYQVGETRTDGDVSFYCTPNGTWATVDPAGSQRPRTPRQLHGIVSLIK